jgi:hypothetical protein
MSSEMVACIIYVYIGNGPGVQRDEVQLAKLILGKLKEIIYSTGWTTATTLLVGREIVWLIPYRIDKWRVLIEAELNHTGEFVPVYSTVFRVE